MIFIISQLLRVEVMTYQLFATLVLDFHFDTFSIQRQKAVGWLYFYLKFVFLESFINFWNSFLARNHFSSWHCAPFVCFQSIQLEHHLLSLFGFGNVLGSKSPNLLDLILLLKFTLTSETGLSFFLQLFKICPVNRSNTLYLTCLLLVRHAKKNHWSQLGRECPHIAFAISFVLFDVFLQLLSPGQMLQCLVFVPYFLKHVLCSL